jgi:aspartate aminotransferase
MISDSIRQSMAGGSMIRKMFEEGIRLAKLYGKENVYDFSLGNPDGEPPQETLEALHRLALEPGIHQYMPNAGFPDVRARMAAFETARSGVEVDGDLIVMTVGAAGGLNVAMKALLNPGDEVLVLAPYFVEYLTYIRNHGGVPVVVPTDPETFQPDCAAVEAAMTPRTRAILLNSPHNPTGVVYSRAVLEALNDTLIRRGEALGLQSPVCVLSDEPYSRLVYDGVEAPAMMSIFTNVMVINSFSKALALPGERIGYVAVHPGMQEAREVAAALAYTNRTLGFVNAPGLLQKAVAASLEANIDIAEYQARRDLLHGIVTESGFTCAKPQGAFYLFMKSPIEDDRAFSDAAAKYNLLIVPGSGFGGPGYVRLAYCVSRDLIERSREAWHKLGKEFFA